MKNGLDLIVLYTCLTKKQKYDKTAIGELMAKLKQLSDVSPAPSADELKPLVGHLRFFGVLQKIAQENATDAFGADTVSFYWKCSPAMRGGNSHNEAVLSDYQRMPTGPIHERIIAELNNCFVFDGRVVSEFSDGVRVLAKRKRIVDQDGKPAFGTAEEEVIVTRGEAVKGIGLHHGDHVTLHWNVAVEKINEQEALALNEETQNALDRFNTHRA